MSPASYQTAPPRDDDRTAVGLPSHVVLVGGDCGRVPPYRPTALPPYCLPKAGNGIRTRDPNLGKVVLYQLSYSRETNRTVADFTRPTPARLQLLRKKRSQQTRDRPDGGEGNRTPDLLNAIQALSQLSYAPEVVVADDVQDDYIGRRGHFCWEHGKLVGRFKRVKRTPPWAENFFSRKGVLGDKGTTQEDGPG